MPFLARKLLIFATVDGLILQPLGQRSGAGGNGAGGHNGTNSRGGSTVIRFRNSNEGGNGGGIESVVPKKNGSELDDASKGKCFEAFGIVGLITLSKSSFLVSITRRQQVAQIQGKPIYVITEVALTPLSSRAEAEAAISRTQGALRRKAVDEAGLESEESDSEDENTGPLVPVSDDVEDDDPGHGLTAPGNFIHKRTSSVAEDVMAKRGGYGRFAQKWFSKRGWTVGQRRNLGMSVEGEREPASSGDTTPREEIRTPEPSIGFFPKEEQRDLKERDVAETLLPKLLRTTQVLFGTSRSFYFSYDYDLTKSFANRRAEARDVPLHAQADPLFFWNRRLIQPFVDAGQTTLVLPLIQGFVGQRSFIMDSDPPAVPDLSASGRAETSMQMTDMSPRVGTPPSWSDAVEKHVTTRDSQRPYLLTLISRRSVKRAGVRFLRRGIDEDGNTANSVETEQILSDSEWARSSKIYSFVQLRGSIPIFFSQSPYAFKPVPQVQHSDETNFRAFKRHFEGISERYGALQIANLVEKHGAEAIVGEKYESLLGRLNNNGGANGASVDFQWFDFHAECRGMKFENVSLLVDALDGKLRSFGITVETDGKRISKQAGVLRTNCMDCLDRTNVVQSACGRRVLESQLKSEGIDISLQVDQSTHWFDTMWADNGDAISKQYASTAALKGDFTRTRKRNYKGALTDMGLSISRYYSGIVNDYFSQAVIDFLLGNVTSLVFEDFEANLMTNDPGVSTQALRQQAIELSHKMAVADEHEELVGGWTLLMPQAPNTIKSTPFEEVVLLLTDAALYACRFDFNVEKVKAFERVDVKSIDSIKLGTYITSTLSPAQADESRNVGFVVVYHARDDDVTRINTRTLSTTVLTTPPRTETNLPDGASTASSSSPSNPAATSSKPKTGLALLTTLGRQSAPAAPTSAPTRVLALKALPAHTTGGGFGDGSEVRVPSEREQVDGICGEIERVVAKKRVEEGKDDKSQEGRKLIKEEDIISLDEAKKATGLFEMLGHSIKMLVWA